MSINKVLSPKMSNRTILFVVFVYLTIVTMLLINSAKPFESTAALDFGISASPVSAAEVIPTIDFQTPTFRVPAPPYIIIGSVK